MTPQSEGRYATSLLFTPRSADGRGSGADYRPQKTGVNATRSPSPEQGRQHREGSFFREGSVGMGSVAGFQQGGGRPFGREGSVYREGSVQPDTPAAGRRGGALGERSRLGPAPPETAARGTAANLGRGYSPGLATSRGRRRSTTPQPAPQEAPPPPPTDSLFINPDAVGAVWATPTTAEPSGASDGDGEQPQEPEPPGSDNSDQWVIVYGFKAGYVELLLREFSKCGEILQHGTFGAPAAANWLYLQFQDKWAAQRALYRDGEQLSTSLMIGVRPLDDVHRAAIRRHLDADPGSQRSLAPKPALTRKYMIHAGGQQQGGTGVPPPSQSMWAKVNEFVFGL